MKPTNVLEILIVLIAIPQSGSASALTALNVQ
jgi:hypothetical protein